MTNSADPDQLVSSEAKWSGSTLFAKIGHVVFSKRRVKVPQYTVCSGMSATIIRFTVSHTTFTLPQTVNHILMLPPCIAPDNRDHFFYFSKKTWAAMWETVLYNMFSQWSLKSVCASLQSDHSLCSLHDAIQNAPSEDSDQTMQMRMLIWIFTECKCPKVHFLTLCPTYLGYSLESIHGSSLNESLQHYVYSEKIGKNHEFLSKASYLKLCQTNKQRFCMLGKKFNRRNLKYFFFFFSENRIWHFSTWDYLHEMSKPIFCENKNIINLSSAEFTQKVPK